MKISGRQFLEAPRAAVFDAICDPQMLLEVIPGCHEISQESPNEYHATIALRLPAIVGTYDTWVWLINTEPPVLGEMEGRMVGRAGSIAGRAAFRLTEEEGGTVVHYVGSAIIGGPLARLDSRFVEGLATSLINGGLNRLGERLQRIPTPAGRR